MHLFSVKAIVIFNSQVEEGAVRGKQRRVEGGEGEGEGEAQGRRDETILEEERIASEASRGRQ